MVKISNIRKKLKIEHLFDKDTKWYKSIYTFNEDESEYIVLLGLNPAFNDNDFTDRTNLILINTILNDNNFKNIKGYILYNLSNVQCKESKKIINKSFTNYHTSYVISELQKSYNQDHKLCLFYGRNSLKKHKKIIEKYYGIFKEFLDVKRLYYTKDVKGFTHPSVFKKNLLMEQVKKLDVVCPPPKNK